MGLLFNRFDGRHGRITIPKLGLTVGTMENWSVTRREETTPELGAWDLRAVFSYINPVAFNSEYDKKITCMFGDPRHPKAIYEVTFHGPVVLEGRSMLAEGIDFEFDPEATQ